MINRRGAVCGWSFVTNQMTGDHSKLLCPACPVSAGCPALLAMLTAFHAQPSTPNATENAVTEGRYGQIDQ